LFSFFFFASYTKMSATAATEQSEISVKESFEDLQSEFTDSALERVTIDTVSILRLVKDSMDSQPEVTVGRLLGFDMGTTVEITNCFPVPMSHGETDESEKSEDSLTETVIRCYREANIDTAQVGWYTTSYGDNVFTDSDTIAGQYNLQMHNPKGILLVFDPFRAMLEGVNSCNPLSIHAYRLTAEFMELYKAGKFTVDSFLEHNVTYKTIFEEIPIFVRPAFPSAIGSLLQRAEVEPEFQTDHSVLDTTISPLLERSVEFLVGKFDEMEASQSRFAQLQRIFNTLQRRHKMGQEVLTPSQNSQLDNLLLTWQMTYFCEQAMDAASESTAKLYFVNEALKDMK